MPKISKKDKQLWSFFIDPKTNRRTYHDLCRRCCNDCKQSFRMISIYCPKYLSKRSKGAKMAKDRGTGNQPVANDKNTVGKVRMENSASKAGKTAPFYYRKTKSEVASMGSGMLSDNHKYLSI